MFKFLKSSAKTVAEKIGEETEYLLPYHKKDIKLEEVDFIKTASLPPDTDTERLKQEIDRLGHWEYFIDFNNGITTRLNATFNDGTVNFHRYRSKLITDTVCRLLGEDLSEASVLDMASHCGYFSLDIAHKGVKQVLGIEYREKNVAQAEFLKRQFGIANCEFRQGDVYELEPQDVDVVLCLGLIYHLVRPIDVLELCYASAKKFAVVESICHKESLSAYKVVGDKNVDVAIEGTRPVELQPTYRGLIDSMRQVGFNTIIEIVGTCSTPIDLFSDGYRRCLIGIKDNYTQALDRISLENR